MASWRYFKSESLSMRRTVPVVSCPVFRFATQGYLMLLKDRSPTSFLSTSRQDTRKICEIHKQIPQPVELSSSHSHASMSALGIGKDSRDVNSELTAIL